MVTCFFWIVYGAAIVSCSLWGSNTEHDVSARFRWESTSELSIQHWSKFCDICNEVNSTILQINRFRMGSLVSISVYKVGSLPICTPSHAFVDHHFLKRMRS